MKLLLLSFLATAVASEAVKRRVTIKCRHPKRDPVDFTFEIFVAPHVCDYDNNDLIQSIYITRMGSYLALPIYSMVLEGSPDCLADWTFYGEDGKTAVAWIQGPWTDLSKSENAKTCEALPSTSGVANPFCLCTRIAPIKEPRTFRVPERTNPQGR